MEERNTNHGLKNKNQKAAERKISLKSNQEASNKGFDNIINAFEKLLLTIQGNEDEAELILTKMINVQNILSNKILLLYNELKNVSVKEKRKKIVKRKLKKKLDNIQASQEVLSSEKNAENIESVTKVMKYVVCPFCSEIVDDKIAFVKHLEDCEQCKKKIFIEKKVDRPYSVFKILPSGAIKCNACPNAVCNSLKYYLVHILKETHKNNIECIQKTRKCTDALYCCCCKTFIPNSLTQITFHLQHDYHKEKRGESMKFSIKQGISCILLRNKIKCLVCSLSYPAENNFQEYEAHVTSSLHFKNLKTMLLNETKIFCEVCDGPVKESNLGVHCLNSLHNDKSDNYKKISDLQLCFYCGWKCFDLSNLFTHMKQDCTEIMALGLKMLSEKPMQENATTPKLADPSNKTVQIDKPNINDFSREYFEFENINETDSSSDNNENVCDYDNDDDDDDDDDGDDGDNEYKPENVNKKKNVEYLFKFTCSALSEKIQKFDFMAENEILNDCTLVVSCKSYFVGFRGCKAATPDGDINIYCDIAGTFLKFVPAENFREITTVVVKILQKIYVKIRDSKLWKNAVLDLKSFPPCVRCIHEKSKKKCILNISGITKQFTDVIGKLMQYDKKVSDFFLIIRYWFDNNKTNIAESDFIVMSLIIYFLRTQYDIPLPEEIDSKPNKILALLKNEKKNMFPEKRVFSKETIVDLFQSFLQFLHKFNYADYIICPSLDFPVKKTILMDVVVREDEKLPYFLTETAHMYITDFDMSSNLGNNFTKEDIEYLLSLIQTALDNF